MTSCLMTPECHDIILLEPSAEFASAQWARVCCLDSRPNGYIRSVHHRSFLQIWSLPHPLSHTRAPFTFKLPNTHKQLHYVRHGKAILG